MRPCGGHGRQAMSVDALPEGLRAQLHLQLAALERAGIPPQQALGMLDLGPEVRARAQRALQQLQAGRSLAAAGRLSGLFTPIEGAVIEAAVQGGSPARAHQRLGERAQVRHRAWQQLRARLLLPAFVLLLAMLILPLPAVVAGSLSIGAYLLRNLLLLAGLFALVQLGRTVYRRQAAAEDWPGREALEQALLAMPVLGPLAARVQVQRFLEHLGLLLDCGLPAAQAAEHAASTLRLQCVRADFEASVAPLQQGRSLCETARTWAYARDPALQGMLAAGEGSGRVAELIERYAASEAEAVASRIDSLMTWMPRLLYAALALWIASGFLRGMLGIVRRANDL